MDETELPLRAGMIDRVIAVHLLEMTPDAGEVLREVWRVLAPGGRLICVVPTRRGVWARTENNPFGHGRPFSRTQITDLLRGARCSRRGLGRGALHAARAAQLVPALGRGLGARRRDAGAAFAGVHVVERRSRSTSRAHQARAPPGRVRAVMAPQPMGG